MLARKLPDSVQGLSCFVVLAILVGVFSYIEPRFLSQQNMTNILLQAAPLILVALGQAIVVISGGLDLSQGSAAALAGMLGVLAATTTGSPVVGWTVVLLASVALGAINGTLVAAFGVPSFIATVGMLTYADGLAYFLGGGLPFEFPPDGYSWFGRDFIGDVPASLVFTAAVAALTIAAVNYTPLGRSFYLVGDNPRAAALAGLPVKRIRFVAFMCCGLLTGLATLILTGRIDSAPPNLSPALPFEAIAAVAIGGIAMSGGEGALWRAVLGSIPIVVLVNGLNLVGIGTYIQMIAIGFITIAVVALDHVQKQGFPRFFARSASATNTARAR